MNKTELTQAIAEKMKCGHRNAANFLDGLIDVIIETVGKGEDVNIIGFGQFKVIERSARSAKDFRSGKTIEVPAHKTVTFHVGNGLKQAVKGK